MVTEVKKMKPELVEDGPKMEPRGAKTQSGMRKMAQDSTRQRQRAAQEAQPGLWWKAGAPEWRPKSIEIGSKINEKNKFYFDNFVWVFL